MRREQEWVPVPCTLRKWSNEDRAPVNEWRARARVNSETALRGLASPIRIFKLNWYLCSVIVHRAEKWKRIAKIEIRECEN